MARLPGHTPDAHWYHPDGRPAHRQPIERGNTRPTTLDDARALGLYPSVTGALDVVAKPALDQWKTKEAILAAERNPRTPNEPDGRWTDRVRVASERQVRDAARIGSRVHAAMEGYWRGDPIPNDLRVYCDPLVDWLRRALDHALALETVVVSRRRGYAGTVDIDAVSRRGARVVADFKTRRTKPGQTVTARETQPMQIAAYAGALTDEDFSEVWGVNLYVSTTEPGRFAAITYDPDRLRREYIAFRAALHLWQHLNDYYPGA